MAGKDERTRAAWICCPWCDLDLEEPKGTCPGRYKCNEITRYLEMLKKREEEKNEHP